VNSQAIGKVSTEQPYVERNSFRFHEKGKATE
jgi:hypothetical protein